MQRLAGPFRHDIPINSKLPETLTVKHSGTANKGSSSWARTGKDNARALPGGVGSQLATHEEAQVLVQAAHERSAGRDAVAVERLALCWHVLTFAQSLRARLLGGREERVGAHTKVDMC